MGALCTRSPPILAACISSSVATIHLYANLTWLDTQCPLLDESLLFIQRRGRTSVRVPLISTPDKSGAIGIPRNPRGRRVSVDVWASRTGRAPRSGPARANRPGANALPPDPAKTEPGQRSPQLARPAALR